MIYLNGIFCFLSLKLWRKYDVLERGFSKRLETKSTSLGLLRRKKSETYIAGQFHLHGCYSQTQFSNFNLAQTEFKGEFSSFPFVNMFVPTDMLTWLYNFAN